MGYLSMTDEFRKQLSTLRGVFLLDDDLTTIPSTTASPDASPELNAAFGNIRPPPGLELPSVPENNDVSQAYDEYYNKDTNNLHGKLTTNKITEWNSNTWKKDYYKGSSYNKKDKNKGK